MPEHSYPIYLLIGGGLAAGILLCLIPGLIVLFRKSTRIATLAAEKDSLEKTLAARDQDEVRLKDAFQAPYAAPPSSPASATPSRPATSDATSYSASTSKTSG